MVGPYTVFIFARRPWPGACGETLHLYNDDDPFTLFTYLPRERAIDLL